MRLSEGEPQKSYKVSGTNLPLRVVRRLEALGMTQNTAVEVVNKKRHGAMVVKVRGTRFALGKHIVENIEVEGGGVDGGNDPGWLFGQSEQRENNTV